MSAPTITALVTHARDVPSAEREAFAARLAPFAERSDVLILHTCQRVEVYLSGQGDGLPGLPELPRGGRRLEDAVAVRHLICVVCGLDSAVLGEEQVLHQVRQAFVRRRAEGRLDTPLDRLFQVALQAGKRAHSWYPTPRPSLADVALDEIESRLEALAQAEVRPPELPEPALPAAGLAAGSGGPRRSLAGRHVLIVGAGMMARLAARAASGRHALVTVTNRTDARAAELAASVGGRMRPWQSPDPLPPLAGVIVAIGGRWTLEPGRLAELLAGPAVVADLSSPPALSASVQRRLGERYRGVDSFAWGPESQLDAALRDRLDALVSDSGREFCRWLRAREGSPTIQELTEAAERRREAELDWLLRRLPDLSESERAAIEQMSRRLVAGLLHEPRRAINLDETGALGRAARQLFALPEPDRAAG